MPGENEAPDPKTDPKARESGRSPGQGFQALMDGKVRPVLEKAGAFYNARNLREKTMIVIFGAVFIIFLDYWLLIRPVVHVFTDTIPKLHALDQELEGLRADKKNRAAIAREWEESKAQVATQEEMFITRDRVPALLENISKLALDSGVKILSLRPVGIIAEKGKGKGKAGGSKGYSLVPITLNAQAGTHELGSFLARLENGPAFFRVKDLRISARGEQDVRRHDIEVNIETYCRNQLSGAKK
jgi:Tfp pilus assembly protein PilO